MMAQVLEAWCYRGRGQECRGGQAGQCGDCKLGRHERGVVSMGSMLMHVR